MNSPNIEAALKSAGGAAAIALLFGIKIQSIMSWKRQIPDARLRALECLLPALFFPRPELIAGSRTAAIAAGLTVSGVVAWANYVALKVAPEVLEHAQLLFPEIAGEKTK